jgi:hypothetical protein
LTVENALQRHGFHFTVPSSGDASEIFLDVMGLPPRVGSFASALGRSRDIDTDWGCLHTVGIQELVELKKTQRPRDYPIISRLALVWFEEKAPHWSADDLEWVLSNIFSLPEMTRLFRARPELLSLLPETTPDLVRRAAEQLAGGDQIEEAIEDELEEWFDRRMAPLRRADRHFWRSVIDSLRQLRTRGELMQEGAPV